MTPRAEADLKERAQRLGLWGLVASWESLSKQTWVREYLGSRRTSAVAVASSAASTVRGWAPSRRWSTSTGSGRRSSIVTTWRI